MTALSNFSDHEDEILAEYEKEDANEDCENLNDIDEEEQKENVPKNPSKSEKHVTRNPMPKLNTERLKGPKGIHTIEKHFEGFKFHGKGHEKKDLDRVMKRLEHWAHRLFPKLDFDDFLEKTEKLGSKKDLSVFVTKYRNDMISFDDGEISQNNVSDDEPIESNSTVDAFDLLIAEQIEKQKEASVQPNLNKNDISINDRANMLFVNAFEQCSTQTDKVIETSSSQTNTSELSDEIKERIERNRQMAIERRLARLKAMKENEKKKEIGEDTEMEISK
ncbi:protein TIPIN homolog [Vespa crabro]|uniref:protein TIPIN homolog n=1 Tax=Vespa crabro TaxID=7445 RepID=UPI001F00275A|nr:protein TIPIN homolog [Vespa crabro]